MDKWYIYSTLCLISPIEDWTKEFEEEYKKSTALFDQLNAQQQNDTNQNTSSPNETIEVRGKGRRIRMVMNHQHMNWSRPLVRFLFQKEN